MMPNIEDLQFVVANTPFKIDRLRGSGVLIKRTSVDMVETKHIILPDTARNCYDKFVAEVVAVGPGEILANGEREPMGGLKPGDKIGCWSGFGTKIGENYYILDISEIELRIEET